MKVDLGTVAAPREAGRPDSAVQHPPGKLPASMERRSPARLGSRGDKHRISPPVVVNIVQVTDSLLLLFCGLLARIMLTPLGGLHSDGSLFLATATAAFVVAVFLSRGDAYLLTSLRSLGQQLKAAAYPAGGRCRQHDGLPVPYEP